MSIVSIKHKGLKLLWTKGDRSKVNALQIKKLVRVLTIIDALEQVPEDLVNLINLKPHKLSETILNFGQFGFQEITALFLNLIMIKERHQI